MPKKEAHFVLSNRLQHLIFDSSPGNALDLKIKSFYFQVEMFENESLFRDFINNLFNSQWQKAQR